MHKVLNKNTQDIKKIEINKILEHYRFTEEDVLKLIALQPLAKEILPKLLSGFYEFIFSFEHAKTFIHNESLRQKHQAGISAWFLQLFSGEYNKNYFYQLNVISETHVKIGLPTHYVNTAFSFVRGFLVKSLLDSKNLNSLTAMHKIIDINLDILSLTYKEEEQQQLLNEVILIKKALESENVVPYVQPIVHTKSGKVSKYECLMRLIDTDNRKIHSIYPFLHTARSTLLYEDLMRKMVEKSFDVFDTYDSIFTINISYEDIINDSFYTYLHEKIKVFSNPERIIFEILETDSIVEFDIVLSFITEFRKYGCKIAIDDFGSGYSNIENILKLKPEYIKIDNSLIKDLDHSTEALSIVKNVINIAKDMKAETIAEHVHTKEIYEIVRTLDIDYLQGYYLGKPFPASTLK